MTIYDPVKCTVQVEFNFKHGGHHVIRHTFLDEIEASHCFWAIQRLFLATAKETPPHA